MFEHFCYSHSPAAWSADTKSKFHILVCKYIKWNGLHLLWFDSQWRMINNVQINQRFSHILLLRVKKFWFFRHSWSFVIPYLFMVLKDFRDETIVQCLMHENKIMRARLNTVANLESADEFIFITVTYINKKKIIEMKKLLLSNTEKLKTIFGSE